MNHKDTRDSHRGSSVNGESLDYDPFVAPDGTYLIFSSHRAGGYGESDLYISYKREGDGWNDPINLGPQVNSSAEENCPSVTLDGRYFFFTSNRNREANLLRGVPPATSMSGSGSRDIYWMKADPIDEFRKTPQVNRTSFSPD